MKTFSYYRDRLVTLLLVVAMLQQLFPLTAHSFDWVPTDEEIKKYRQTWNPFSEGPLLIQAVDIHPQGQLSVRPFFFSQVTEKSYGNTLSFPTDAKGGPVHTYAIQPLITAAYGLTTHVELGVSTSMISFWTKDTESANKGKGPWTTDTGMGDTSLIM